MRLHPKFLFLHGTLHFHTAADSLNIISDADNHLVEGSCHHTNLVLGFHLQKRYVKISLRHLVRGFRQRLERTDNRTHQLYDNADIQKNNDRDNADAHRLKKPECLGQLTVIDGIVFELLTVQTANIGVDIIVHPGRALIAYPVFFHIAPALRLDSLVRELHIAEGHMTDIPLHPVKGAGAHLIPQLLHERQIVLTAAVIILQ